MALIDSKEALERWLGGHEREFAGTISCRAALRVLPRIRRFESNVVFPPHEPEVFLPFFCVANASFMAARSGSKETIEAARAAGNAIAFRQQLPTNVDVTQRAMGALNAAGLAFSNDAREVAAWAVGLAASSLYESDVEGPDRTLESAFWEAVSEDCRAFDQGVTATSILERPLWFGCEKQDEISPALSALGTLFNGDPKTWGFWFDWYQRVLDGGYQNQKLLYDIAILPNEDWEKGPEHIAGLIAEIEARHTVSSRRTGERMVWDATPGELAFIATVPASPKMHRDGLANVLEEVAAFGDPDQLPQHHGALRDILVDLKDRIGRYGENQQRMHELFLRELGNVREMLAAGEVASDRRVSNLTGAMDTTALDIRTTNADVMASHLRRIAGREAELSPEKAATLREIAGEIAQRGNAEVKEEIGADIAIVVPYATAGSPVLRANKDERISAMDRTTRRLPEALIVMKDAGVVLAPRVVNGATKGYAIGKMFADLMEVLRPYTGL